MIATLLLLLANRGWSQVAPQFGVVEFREGKVLCATLPGPEVKLPSPAVAAFFDPPLAVKVSLTKIASQPCSEEMAGRGTSYTADEVAKRPWNDYPIGIIVLGGGYTTRQTRAGGVELRDGKKHSITLRLCASMEGLHLTAWQDRLRVWHEYYYVGYDLESNCSEKEARE